MMDRLGRFGILAVAVMAGLATPALAQDQRIEWQETMRAGQVLRVQNITGDMRVVSARGGVAEVVAEKHGRESDFDRIDIVIEQGRDGYTVCALFDQPGRTTCDGRDDRERDDDSRSLRASVDFEVSLPPGVEFTGSTVTGDVVARDLDSDVTASTVTGDIEISTTGLAEANTVTGSIDIEMGSSDWRDLSYHTVTGDITVRLPRDIDTDIEFESLSGDFESDFDVRAERTRGRFVGARVEGTIGEGGRSISLKTVSGDARLLRGPAISR